MIDEKKLINRLQDLIKRYSANEGDYKQKVVVGMILDEIQRGDFSGTSADARAVKNAWKKFHECAMEANVEESGPINWDYRYIALKNVIDSLHVPRDDRQEKVNEEII